jgi:hypothetical protein
MKSIACLLLIAIAAMPLRAKGIYHVHAAHKAHAQPKPAAPTPSPPPTPAPTTNQMAIQTTYPSQPVRYVIQRPVSAVKAEAGTNSPPPVPRGPEDAPKVSATTEDPIVEYQKADAAKGFPEAQFALGIRYLSGNGVTQDEAKGKELIRAAADQGSERAREKARELRAAGKL